MPAIFSRGRKDREGAFDLVRYVFRQKYSRSVTKDERERLGQYIFTMYSEGQVDDWKEVAHDMQEQAHLLKQRKDGVYFGHDFITFHRDDFDLSRNDEKYIYETRATMMDFTRQWIEARGLSSSTYVARPHFDTKAIHVHLAYVYQQERDSNKRCRIDRAAFLEAQNKVNEYQREQERYRHLKAHSKEIQPLSRPRGRDTADRILDRDQVYEDVPQSSKRKRPPSKKRLFLAHLSTAVDGRVRNIQELRSYLEKLTIGGEQVRVYESGGVPSGFIYKNRQNKDAYWRFTTLLGDTGAGKTVERWQSQYRAVLRSAREQEQECKRQDYIKDREAYIQEIKRKREMSRRNRNGRTNRKR